MKASDPTSSKEFPKYLYKPKIFLKCSIPSSIPIPSLDVVWFILETTHVDACGDLVEIDRLKLIMEVL